jgi:hypothetical protein
MRPAELGIGDDAWRCEGNDLIQTRRRFERQLGNKALVDIGVGRGIALEQVFGMTDDLDGLSGTDDRKPMNGLLRQVDVLFHPMSDWTRSAGISRSLHAEVAETAEDRTTQRRRGAERTATESTNYTSPFDG